MLKKRIVSVHRNSKKVLLIGNPNCGKTSLFNHITNSIERTGNYPGVTVGIKESKGINLNLTFIDLPGIYSLNVYTEEEQVTCDFILKNEYALIINVFDPTNFDKSLFLSLQLLSLKKRMIIVCTMKDICEKNNITLYTNVLQSMLKIPVLHISCCYKQQIKQLEKFLKQYE